MIKKILFLVFYHQSKAFKKNLKDASVADLDLKKVVTLQAEAKKVKNHDVDQRFHCGLKVDNYL